MSIRHYSMHIIHFFSRNRSHVKEFFLNLLDRIFFVVVLAQVVFEDKNIYLLAYKRLQIV